MSVTVQIGARYSYNFRPELKRWFRGEAMNPKYIQGMKNMAIKGAGDLAT